jgi:hypothetical protein
MSLDRALGLFILPAFNLSWVCPLSAMNKTASRFLSVLLLLLLAVSVRADTLTLKDGRVLEGRYVGGTENTVRFETSVGVQIFAFSEVSNMNGSAPSAPAAAPVAAPVPVSVSITLPAGTTLMVQMLESVSSQSEVGTNFMTRLQYDIVVDGRMAVRAGTAIYGKVQHAQQAGRLFGHSELDIRLTQMVPNGTPVPLMTTSYAEQGEASGKKTAVAAGMGAIIGNNTGGSGGSGAAWGLAAAALKPGQSLTVPPGAILEFSLTQPVTFNVTR